MIPVCNASLHCKGSSRPSTRPSAPRVLLAGAQAWAAIAATTILHSQLSRLCLGIGCKSSDADSEEEEEWSSVEQREAEGFLMPSLAGLTQLQVGIGWCGLGGWSCRERCAAIGEAPLQPAACCLRRHNPKAPTHYMACALHVIACLPLQELVVAYDETDYYLQEDGLGSLLLPAGQWLPPSLHHLHLPGGKVCLPRDSSRGAASHEARGRRTPIYCPLRLAGLEASLETLMLVTVSCGWSTTIAGVV